MLKLDVVKTQICYLSSVSSAGVRDSKLDAEVKLLRTSGHSVGRVESWWVEFKYLYARQ